MMMIASHFDFTRLWELLSDHHHGVKARTPLVGYGDASGHCQSLAHPSAGATDWAGLANDFLTTLRVGVLGLCLVALFKGALVVRCAWHGLQPV